MLTVENVSAGYGGPPVVRDISFSLPERGRLCIVGPNGSGKSTLLKVIAGLLPSTGRIELDGEALTRLSRRDFAARVGLLSQFSEVYFDYSVWDTVMMGRYRHQRGRLFAAPSPADREAVEESLRATNLLEFRERSIMELSGGQLQRVFLARVLAQDPKLILLDEPTNHLDIKIQHDLIDYLITWSSRAGRCVVGVLHDINLAAELADTLLVLSNGRVSALGSSADILHGSALADAYGMDVGAAMRKALARWA